MNPDKRSPGGLWSLAAPRLDLPLLVALLLVSVIGLMTLHSAAGGNDRMVWSQAARIAVGFAAIWVISRIPPLQLRRWTPWLMLASVVLVLLVPFFGTGRSGRHWLNLGVIYLQPAELMKLTVPMAVAALLHGRPLPPGWGSLFGCALLIGVPTAAIMLQPDLGTAMLVAASGVFAVFLAGVAWWRIGLLAGAALASLPIIWTQLRTYQQQRILTFLDPENDPLGSGWNIIQSKIAVGSGGLFGKGWGEGTQSRLNFLPEHTTDFILAVFAEEFGLVGVLVLLALYLFIIARCLWIAANARETYSRLLAGALGLTFFVYVVVNGGMISGLLPVVGVPMPLLSFGGTSAVSLLAGFGIVMSIHAHRRFMA
jgi:rod shape determining protein RodA